MSKFSIIDTETNWSNEVMSIGVIISDDTDFEPIEINYYIINPECLEGGMYSHCLYFNNDKMNVEYTRKQALTHIIDSFSSNSVSHIFAYNASFDYNHLSELNHYKWYDIMKVAAYKQYNPKISSQAECCSTGRLKRNYGVEQIYRLLYDDQQYCEKHNALTDAYDELMIMKSLGRKVSDYIRL